MIDLPRAMEIIREQYPELFVSSVGKIKKGWVISFENEDGKELRISPIFISKDTGEVSVFFPPEHREELKDYVKVELQGDKLRHEIIYSIWVLFKWGCCL